MKTPSRVCVSVMFLAFVALFTGCGGGNLPELGTVTGKITLDDKPLVDAIVEFYPENGRPSQGVTDAQGNYELNYKPGVMGAVVGKHVVRISKFEGEATEEGGEEEVEAAVVDEERKNLVPIAYNERSKLTADVKSGSNTFNFTLSSTAEAEEGEDEDAPVAEDAP